MPEFDEHGNEIEGSHDAPAADAPEQEEPEQEAAPKGKYRIGEREFATMEEAHAFATSQLSTLETEKLIADAHRQGMQEAISQIAPPAAAAPEPQDDFNEEEYYADPKAFLKKFAEKIQTQAVQTVTQKQSEKEMADNLWRQFTARHPDLADFRNEVEATAGEHLNALRAVNQTKGIDSGFDFIALKLRGKFSQYAQAVKPRKDLSNSKGQQPPAGKGSGVTPPKQKEKPLSMSEQVRSIKLKRR